MGEDQPVLDVIDREVGEPLEALGHTSLVDVVVPVAQAQDW